MRLTSEEHQKLRSNLQKIEDYIVSEICPHMCNDSGSSFDTYVEAGMALLREWPRIKEALRAHLVKVSLNKSVLDTFAV